MLRAGFLKTLSDWTAEAVSREPEIMENAGKSFGYDLILDNFIDREDEERLPMLFSEWLVFDHKQKIFDNQTGLQYFTGHNPLNLPDDEIKAYRELLQFEVGLFEVKGVEQGRGVFLESIGSDNKNFVNDVNASLFLKIGDTVWTRIAPINGVFHAVGSSLFSMPIKIMEGMRSAMSGWEKNSFDAREIAEWLARTGKTPDPDSDLPFSAKTYVEAEKNFAKALKKCGMGKMFSTRTFKKWITNEKKYGMSFATKAIMFLIPDDIAGEADEELFQAAGEFANFVPRKFLVGKTPAEVFEKMSGEEKEFEIEVLTKDDFEEKFKVAHKLVAEGEFEKSYKSFEGIIRDLLNERIPLFHSFRIFANAAVCCFNKEDFLLGEELVEASLRLNPLYDFALRLKDNYVKSYDDYSGVKKGYKKLAKSMRAVLKEAGQSEYKRTVFRKYEKFLQDIGVSLEHKTKTIPTVHSFGEDYVPAHKIGRNDLCYCGSGKKFKKCCGK